MPVSSKCVMEQNTCVTQVCVGTRRMCHINVYWNKMHLSHKCVLEQGAGVKQNMCVFDASHALYVCETKHA